MLLSALAGAVRHGDRLVPAEGADAKVRDDVETLLHGCLTWAIAVERLAVLYSTYCKLLLQSIGSHRRPWTIPSGIPNVQEGSVRKELRRLPANDVLFRV